MTPAKKASPAKTGAPDWEKAIAQLGEGSSEFFFIKANKTRIKLVCLEEDLERFYAMTTTSFKGREKTRYVVFGSVIGADKELQDKWVNAIVPIVISKTALRGILSLLAEGYDLFDEEKGFGITIIRSGQGTDTDYNVMPSPAPVPLALKALEQPKKSLLEYAEALASRSTNKEDKKDVTDW